MQPPTLAATPHHLGLGSGASPPCSPRPPSIPDPALTPSPMPSTGTADQVSRPPPHPGGRPVSSAQVTPLILPRLEKDPSKAWVGPQAPVGSSHAASFRPGIPDPRPPGPSPLTRSSSSPSSGTSFLLVNPTSQHSPFPRRPRVLQASFSSGVSFPKLAPHPRSRPALRI